MKKSRTFFVILLSAIFLCLITTTAIAVFAADNSVYVTSEEELIDALNDSTVNKVIVANDIEITEASSVEINGANKVMDGSNYKITFAKYFTFTANDFVQELKNIDFVSDSSVNLTLQYGGSLTDVDATMMSISTNGTVNITDSHLKTVSATNASKNTFVNSSFQGLTFNKCSSITVDGATIVGTGNNYGICLDTWCSGTIKNTSISNCSHGISADMNGDNATLENVTIENCTYGIYNHGDVNGSTLYLNGVTIKNATKYGIYCTGTNRNGSVRVKADSTLTLDLDAIGIYLKKGSLSIEKDGAIAHTGDYYTVFQDVNSYVSDYAEILNVAKENGAGQYYNVTDKVGGDCYFSSVIVTTEEELQAAIADETISNIELANNITITQSLSIKGMLKVFDGKGFALDFGDKTQSIYTEEYVEFKNLKLQTTSTSTGYISLSNGSSFDTVDAPQYRISTSGTIIVNNSSFFGVSISSAPNSKVLNTAIGAGGISIGSSETCSIENVTIRLGTGGTGINLGNRSGTTIKNVTITGGYYGICADMNGRTATLENVTIENCTYGIYNHGDVNGSTLNLSGVTVKNATKYGIYCTGTNSNGSVRVKADSTLTLDLDAIGIYLKKGYLSIEKDGAIAHIGDYYTVFQDVNSYVSDYAEILNVAKENGAGQYYNVTDKVGGDCYFSSVIVTTEEELQAAIADETISNIELANNITITQSLSIKGMLKVFDGKGFALDFGDKTYSIYTEEYVEFKNLKLQTTSTSTGYISLSNGSSFENVEAPNYRISTSGTITIADSSFYGVSISSAPKSKVLNTAIGAGGISIGSSEDHLIENVTITNGTISLGNRSRGTIKNTTIDGGSIYAALNGQTVTLENVTIKNSARYGIEIYGGVNGSTIELKDVTIQNTGSFAIYCKGSDSSASIYVLENSTLTMEVVGVAIQLETGYMGIQGNISHVGEGYAVVADPKSTCYDSNHQLVLIDDPTTNSKLYLFKGNYDDKVAPELSLNGDSTIELVYGSQYTELGAVAVDNIDGELEVTITGDVNTSHEGEYTITYTVTDYHGNTSTIERKIVVKCNHNYDKKVVTDTYKKSAATCTDAAVYYYCCATCDAKGTTTYTNGSELGHTGGTATCTAKAECTRCHQPYGSMLEHVYTDQDATVTYLKSAATCASKAVYYKNCATCDKAGTATFEYGSTEPHSYTKQVTTDAYKKSSATCTAKAVYYYCCATCNTKGTSTFEHGTTLSHNYTRKVVTDTYKKSAATCTDAAVYYYCCVTCDAKGTTTYTNGSELGHTGGTATCTAKAECTRCHQPYGSMLEHVYTAEDTTDAYLKSVATCTSKAVYYKHCATCDKAGTATFEYGNFKAHSYIEKVEDTYLKSAATCTSKAVYYKSCSDCGVKGTETFEVGDAPSHNYQTAWSSDATSHWHECSKCGDKKDTASHTAGAAATESTAQTCTVCGYVITPALGHTHNYNTTWSNNATEHWHDCIGCSSTKDNAPHGYTNVCDTDCNTCGYVRTITHSYKTEWSSNAVKHWYECTVCGDKSSEADHIPGAEATETADQVCTVCGFVIQEALGHTHNYDSVKKDETNHWKECACGEKNEITAHTWNNGEVTKEATVDEEGVKTYTCTYCSATKTESIPKIVVNIENTDSGVTIEIPSNSQATLPVGTVIDVVNKSNESISDQILDEFAETAETVVTALGVYDLNLMLDGVKIQPNGTVVVTLPAPDSVAEYDRIVVVYIAPDGSYEECKTTVNEDGTISFETDHFSDYAVIGITAAESNSGLGVGAIVGIILGAIAVIGGGFCLYWFVIRKKINK